MSQVSKETRLTPLIRGKDGRMTRFSISCSLAFVACCAIAVAGCSGGKRSWAKNIPGTGPFPVPSNAPGAPPNVPGAPPQQPTPAPGTSPDEVKVGTVFASQTIDDITRRRDSQNGSVDMTAAGEIAGRFVTVSNTSNVLEQLILYDAASIKDAAGKHNGNPANGGRALSQGATFQMVAAVVSLEQDSWTFASKGISVPDSFATYGMTHQGNELYSAQIQVPAYGVYIVNFYRVPASFVKGSSNPPADWFPFGLELNSGYDLVLPPRGIMCYTRAVGSSFGFGIIHDGGQVPPADATQDWASPNPASSGGGGGGVGSPNSAPVIGAITIAPVASGSVSAIHSGLTPRVTIPVSDPDGGTPSLLLQHTSGNTGNGPISITSVGNNQFDLGNLNVTQRVSIVLTATASDGVAGVQSQLSLDVLMPNRFAGIAPLGTWLVTRITNSGTVGNRSRSDGFGFVAVDTKPVKTDGSLWARGDGIPSPRSLVWFGEVNGNTNNKIQAGEVPFGYPNGNVQGGYNGQAFVVDHGSGVREFRTPLTAQQGALTYLYYARAGKTDPATVAGVNFVQVTDYLGVWVINKGLPVVLNSSDEYELNRADPEVDPKLQPSGLYGNSDGYPFE